VLSKIIMKSVIGKFTLVIEPEWYGSLSETSGSYISCVTDDLTGTGDR